MFFEDSAGDPDYEKEKVCAWPRRSQEEFGNQDEDDQEEKLEAPFWYDLLMRLGRMGREILDVKAESEEEEEESEEESEGQADL